MLSSKSLPWFFALILLGVLPYLPVRLIIFRDDIHLNAGAVSFVGVILAFLGLLWYYRMPIEAQPKNYANRLIGMPFAIVAIAFPVGWIGVVAATFVIFPLGQGMILGSREPVIVEVATNVVGALPRRRGACRNWLYLDGDLSGWRQHICFDSPRTKALVEQKKPSASVVLTGWGNDRAIIYWSAKPLSEMTTSTE